MKVTQINEQMLRKIIKEQIDEKIMQLEADDLIRLSNQDIPRIIDKIKNLRQEDLPLIDIILNKINRMRGEELANGGPIVIIQLIKNMNFIPDHYRVVIDNIIDRRSRYYQKIKEMAIEQHENQRKKGLLNPDLPYEEYWDHVLKPYNLRYTNRDK
jgi:hypothetical protein